MTIRRDSVFVSSVLFTIALVRMAAWCVSAALSGRETAGSTPGYRAAAQIMRDLGVSCLAIILVALIVSWTGYLRRFRWAWAVMFVVVWGWAFPLSVLPFLQHKLALSVPEWLYSAMYQPGPARIAAESVLVFALMVIALLIPIKSFFLVRERAGPIVDKSLSR